MRGLPHRRRTETRSSSRLAGLWLLSDKGQCNLLHGETTPAGWTRRMLMLDFSTPASFDPAPLFPSSHRGIQTDLDLNDLADNDISNAIPDLLSDYSAECRDWTLIAREHWIQGRWTRVEELLTRGLQCELESWFLQPSELRQQQSSQEGPVDQQIQRHWSTFTQCLHTSTSLSLARLRRLCCLMPVCFPQEPCRFC